MDYFEYYFNIDTSEESEMLVALLSEIGFDGFIEDDNLLKAYITSAEAPEKFKESIVKNAFSKKELIKSQNWNEIWEKSYDPVVIDDEILIRTSFHQTIGPDFNYEIVIDPKMSFGTGHHETTSLILSAMLDIKFKKKVVADIGCGTGILSIFASMKGAERIDAIDIDDWAVNNSKENLVINNIKNVKCQKGEIDRLSGKKYDIILANINRNVHMNHIEDYASLLNQDGLLLISGIYTSDITIIKELAEKYSFRLDRFHIKNNWTVTLFKKMLNK